MGLLLPFDAETTGLIEYKKPSGSDFQPHIVQLAAALIDEDTRELQQSMNVIVKPDGWGISQEVIDIHGITYEQAMDVGIPEKMALEMFLELWAKCRQRIAFNTTYDNRIIRIAIKRYLDEQTADRFHEGSHGTEWYCTMIHARKVMGGKQPKLEEACKYFDIELQNAHQAWADMQACMDVYWGIQDHNNPKT